MDEMKRQIREQNTQKDYFKSEMNEIGKDVSSMSDKLTRKIDDSARKISDSTYDRIKDLQNHISNFQLDLSYLKSDITNIKMDVKDCNKRLMDTLHELRAVNNSNKHLAEQEHIDNSFNEIKRLLDTSNKDASFGGSMMKKLYPIDALSNKLFNVEEKIDTMGTNLVEHIETLKTELLNQSTTVAAGTVTEEKEKKKTTATRKKAS
ncbi:hypothetical protein SAMD00019534_047160 [Acytostelium subglobosum LB1]|uniref:hypothetical protein n=1 Tax=Acytostelium subglobosum LB1 TaxID=1410327 RepID=UPI000645054D|nr:hypothetical protein SAMD00019534_047160 [Acytostelium subglobosum LB1]GAM21541.1 hypothetical protein SAMD00019534_047160 [Acytostelium subglobosum LB1]|eukprot:XP_012755660.1 hypothetical protein SAMD00019534_047160 [Acytostelium subglobosum LB1]